MEAREHPADGFELHPEIAADFFARHPQVELRRRVAARLEACRQIEQEMRNALFRRHRAEQQHLARSAHDLAAQHLVDEMLHRPQLAARGLERGERDHAHDAVLERDRVTAMVSMADALHAERFPCDLKTRHVFAAVAMHHHRLERACAHRVQTVERIVGAKQGVALAHLSRRADDRVEPAVLGGGQLRRQAHRAHHAGRTADCAMLRAVVTRGRGKRNVRPGRDGGIGGAGGGLMHESLRLGQGWCARACTSDSITWHAASNSTVLSKK